MIDGPFVMAWRKKRINKAPFNSFVFPFLPSLRPRRLPRTLCSSIHYKVCDGYQPAVEGREQWAVTLSAALQLCSRPQLPAGQGVVGGGRRAEVGWGFRLPATQATLSATPASPDQESIGG